MADRIELTKEEQELYDELKELVRQIREAYFSHSPWSEEQEQRNMDIAQKAHDLHMSLKNRGKGPKHHRYMYDNRVVPAEEVEFYNHLHPVEDLLAFINDPDSTKDPEDTTLNEKFDFKIFTRRWGHYDHYFLMRTKIGWSINQTGRFSDNSSDKSGNPGIFMIMKQDSISYPYKIGDLFEWVWRKASEGATKDEVQKAINDIAEWISICEQATPRGMFKELL